MTWNNVDLPEPVLPATRTCCRVPRPRERYCSLFAPVRPIGTRNSSAVLRLQIPLRPVQLEQRAPALDSTRGLIGQPDLEIHSQVRQAGADQDKLWPEFRKDGPAQKSCHYA